MTYFDIKVQEHINKLENEKLKEILFNIISNYCNPSFSSITKKEFDIIIFNGLIELGFLEKDLYIYDIIKKLRVTSQKARNLIYEYNLRKFDKEEKLDELLLKNLKTPSFYREVENIYLELENPLLIDRLKYIIKINGGSATDASFSNTLVKLKEDAFAAVVEHYSKRNGIDIRKELVKAGVLDSDLKKFSGFITKLIDSINDMSLNEIFENIINMTDFIKDKIKEIR